MSDDSRAGAEARLPDLNAPILPSPARFQLKDDTGKLLGSLPLESLEIDRIAWTPYDRGAVAVVHHGRDGGSSLYHVNGAYEDIWLRTNPGQSISAPSLAPNGKHVAYVVEDSPRWLGPTPRFGLQFGGSIWVGSPRGHRQVASLHDAAEILGWFDEHAVVFTRYLPGDLPEQRPFLLDLLTGRLRPIVIQEPHAYAFALLDNHLFYAASELPILTLPAPSTHVSVVSIDLLDGRRDVKSIEQGYLPVSIRRQAGELRYELEGTGFERVLDEDTGRVRTEPMAVEERTVPTNPTPFAGLPMPYVHQVYDTPNDFNGHWACGPTSTLMCILHFGRLDKWPINVSIPSAHESPYGAYVAHKYTAFGTTFDRMQTDASGKPAYGAYGWATDGGMGWAWRMQDYAAKHKLETSFDATATFTKLKSATDAGRPVALSTNLTSAGHIVTVKGTTSDGKLIVNDPYGNRNAGYMNYSGEDVIYTFAEVKAKWFVTVWSTEPVCTPQPETCNGKDDDCDGEVDEDEVCEREALLRGQSWVSPARTTDIDGDGKADVCGRGSAGVWCHLSEGTSWGEKGATLPLSDSNGWDDGTNWGTLRMGDVDGDGRADLCGRSDSRVTCWKSDGTSLTTAMDGPEWSDDSGWAGFQYHSTIRLLDVDGDGKDDLCARAAKGIVCRKSEGEAFGDSFDGPVWSNEAGLDSAKYYGTLRTGDVDGDGREDLCMRTQGGMECFLSDGEGYSAKVTGPAWSDESGWGAMQYWSTIRLADVNGDGRADLCARAAAGLRCHFSEGNSFGDAVEVAALADESGWADPSNYLTLRTGDVDGDGAQDLCIRANAKVICYVWRGDGFESFDGPAWSDGDGWDKPQYFHTIQLGDMNGDGKADLCGRHEAGWRCHPSTGSGFGDAIALEEFTDVGGWAADRYYATILLGGPACIPTQETCNGKDDDCDGEIDEDGVCDVGPGGTGGTGGAGGSGAGGGASGSSGTTGTPSARDHGASEPDGCACRTSPGTNPSHWGLVAWFGLGLGWWLRRRRN
jgi:MYXO-CTERM domain-containing protein